MDVDYETFLVEKIPQTETCFPGLNVRCGTRLIAILGILFGFTCASMLLIKDRKNLTTTTLILVVFLSIFVIVTVMFVMASVMLLMAALDENPGLMSYYIWLSIVYLCVQLVLAILIPLVLIVEGQYPVAIALIWMVIVMIVGLGWTHFISVVSSYRMSLLSIAPHKKDKRSCEVSLNPKVRDFCYSKKTWSTGGRVQLFFYIFVFPLLGIIYFQPSGRKIECHDVEI